MLVIIGWRSAQTRTAGLTRMAEDPFDVTYRPG